jgi:nitrite reductase/ring-hydroxylating ferredoxin subunit
MSEAAVEARDAHGSVLAGTPLGERLRRYWVPFLPADFLERQQARRVRLLGEDLVAYRDRAGRHGLIGDRCAHRGVSLEWGQAADLGLRCPYHGWCFDQSGQCVDIPLEGLVVRDHVRIRAHEVTAVGGLLFAFLGEETPPPTPDLPLLGAAAGELRVTELSENWTHALERIDASSGGGLSAARRSAFEESTGGFRWQRGDEGSACSWTATLPFFASGDEGDRLRAVVPIDDDTSLLIEFRVAEPKGPARSRTRAVVDSVVDRRTHVEAIAPGEDALGNTWLVRLDPRPGQLPRDLAAAARHWPVDDQLGPIADLSTVSPDSAPSPSTEKALEELVVVHLPIWLAAVGTAELATSMHSADVRDTALEGLLEDAAAAAHEALLERYGLHQREPWSAAWAYVWNAESSQRWGASRDRAFAEAWALTWRSAAAALRAGGTRARYLQVVSAGEASSRLATTAYLACRDAARARCWSAAWEIAWGAATAEVRDEEAGPLPETLTVLDEVVAHLVRG